MPAPLSIIIPTLNAAEHLPRLLAQLMDGLADGLIAEVIFADGGSTDATKAIAEDCGAKLVTTRKGRGTQLAAGCAAARGAWLLVLHSDTHLPDTWCDDLRHHITHHPRQAAAFRLRFDSRHPMATVTAGWANLRSRMFDLPYGDQGLLIPAKLYTNVGGYPNLSLMEDVHIARNLRGTLRLLPSAVTTSPQKYQTNGWIRQGTRNMARLVSFLAGSRAATRSDSYDAAPPSNCNR